MRSCNFFRVMVSLVPAAHTVAGHDGAVTDEQNVIFAKKTTAQEFDFYEAIMDCDRGRMEKESDLGVGDLLTDWMPSFYGSLTKNADALDQQVEELVQGILEIRTADAVSLVVADGEKKYLVLSNLYRGFESPSILDIKLGSVLTDEHATPEKAERLKKVSESTTSGSLSFRICGMKIYSETPDIVLPESLSELKQHVSFSDNYLCFNKQFGRGLCKGNVADAIKLFISYSVSPEIAKHYYAIYWKRLTLLYNCLLDYEVRIISGSLLFILENDISEEDLECDQLVYEEDDDNDDNETDEDTCKISTLNLIDFAHAKLVPGQGPDENLLRGIENLKDIFEELKDL